MTFWGVVTTGLSTVRQAKIYATTSARCRSRTRRVLVLPWAALAGLAGRARVHLEAGDEELVTLR